MGGPTMNRRKLLAVLGTSATGAVAGCLGGDDDDEPNGADDPNGDDENGVADENGTDEPNGDDDPNGDPPAAGDFSVSLLDTPATVDVGAEVTVGYQVENVGDAEDTFDVVLEIDGEEIDRESVTLEAGAETTGQFTYDVDIEQTEPLAVTITSDDTSDEVEITVVEPGPQSFVAESTGGFLSLAGETREEAAEHELALQLPPSVDVAEPIIVEGEIENGRWEATDIQLPDVSVQGIAVETEAPDGLEGDFDIEEGIMTVEGSWRMDVGPGEAEPFINATTGESGALTGEFDLEAEEPSVTLVDNQLTVDEIGFDTIDEELGLPREAGEVWLELDMTLSEIGGIALVELVDTPDSVEAGSELTINYRIENAGGSVDTFDVTFEVDGEEIDHEQITVAGGDEEIRSFTYSVSAERTEDMEITVSSGDSSDSASVGADPRTFILEVVDGWGAFGEDTLEDAQDAEFGIDLEPGGDTFDEPIILEGEIAGGEWESTDIQFPDFTLLGMAVDTSAPEGFHGIFDPDEDMLSMEGTWKLDIGPGSAEPSFRATTGESGALEGSLDLDTNPPRATLVSNEERIEASGFDPIDEAIGAPLEPGEAWLLIEAELTGVGSLPRVDFVDVPDEVTAGQELTAEYTVENAGDGGDTFEVNLEVDGEVVEQTEVSLGGGEQTTETFTYEVDFGRTEDLTITVQTQAAVASADVAVRPRTFTMVSTGGFISLEGETREEARDAEFSLELPPSEDIEEPIIIEAIITEGSWESTDVTIPDVTLQGIAIENDAPEGLHGELDLEAGLMTLDGVWEFDFGPEVASPTFEATTLESGALEGGMDLDVDPARITLVENEVVIDEIGFDPIDDELDLPNEPGEAWLEVEFMIEGLEDVDLGADEEIENNDEDNGDE